MYSLKWHQLLGMFSGPFSLSSLKNDKEEKVLYDVIMGQICFSDAIISNIIRLLDYLSLFF